MLWWLRVHRLLIAQYLREVVSCSCLWIAGDAAAQFFELREMSKGISDRAEGAAPSLWKRWDYWRSARTAGLASLVIAPLSMRWYIALDRAFPNKKAVRQRVASEHLIWTPTLLLFYFVVGSVGRPEYVDVTLNQFQQAYLSSLIASWAIVLPAEAINYWVLPVGLWPFVESAAVVTWTSWVSHASAYATRLREAQQKWAKQHSVDRQTLEEYVRGVYRTDTRNVKLMR